MQAEALLCQNLLGGFVLLTFLNTNFSVALIKGCGIGCRTLISVILGGASLHRITAYLIREVRLYNIYVKGIAA